MLIHLVRHAHAGSRTRWEDDDDLRPLSPRGETQAAIVCRSLADEGIDAVWSSRSLRCLQTITPLAENLGLEVLEVDSLYEGAAGGDALDDLLAAASAGLHVAACSHGDVIPALVRTAVRRGADLDGPDMLSKGARYVLKVEGDQVSRIWHLPAPDGRP